MQLSPPALVAVLISREHARIARQVKTFEKLLSADFSDKEYRRLVKLSQTWRELLDHCRGSNLEV